MYIDHAHLKELEPPAPKPPSKFSVFLTKADLWADDNVQYFVIGVGILVLVVIAGFTVYGVGYGIYHLFVWMKFGPKPPKTVTRITYYRTLEVLQRKCDIEWELDNVRKAVDDRFLHSGARVKKAHTVKSLERLDTEARAVHLPPEKQEEPTYVQRSGCIRFSKRWYAFRPHKPDPSICYVHRWPEAVKEPVRTFTRLAGTNWNHVERQGEEVLSDAQLLC